MTKMHALATLVAAISTPEFAQDWLDNFTDGSATDGSPVSWVETPAFGSTFEVNGSDLVITMNTESPVPTISSTRVMNFFPAGASVRARMVATNGPGRYTVAFADNKAGIRGYVASLSTCGPSGGTLELFRGDVLGFIDVLGTIPMPYGPLEEFIVQLDVFDGVVSARAWRPGEPFPTDPMISAPDDTYPEGVASIATQDFGGGNSCTAPGDRTDSTTHVRYAQASATPLTHSSAGDFNADGIQDFFDVQAFLEAFAVGADTADWVDDDELNFFDVQAFLASFADGSP